MRKTATLVAILSIVCILFGIMLTGCDETGKPTGDVILDENGIINEVLKKNPETLNKLIELIEAEKCFDVEMNIVDEVHDSTLNLDATFNGYKSFKMVMNKTTEMIYVVEGEDVNIYKKDNGQEKYTVAKAKQEDLKTYVDNYFNECTTKIKENANLEWAYDETAKLLKEPGGNTLEILDTGFIIKLVNGTYYKVTNIKNVKIDKPTADMLNPYVPSTNANLYKLEVDCGALSPTFDPNVLSYTVEVPAGCKQITITAAAQSSLATIIGDGLQDITKNKSLEVKVTAEDGKTIKVYKIVVTVAPEKSSNNDLKSLTVEGFDLVPAFSKDISNYDVKVPYDTTSVKVEAVADDIKATLTGDGEITLTDKVTTILIQVTAENGLKTIYEIKVTKKDKEVLDFWQGKDKTDPATAKWAINYAMTSKNYCYSVPTLQSEPNVFMLGNNGKTLRMINPTDKMDTSYIVNDDGNAEEYFLFKSGQKKYSIDVEIANTYIQNYLTVWSLERYLDPTLEWKYNEQKGMFDIFKNGELQSQCKLLDKEVDFVVDHTIRIYNIGVEEVELPVAEAITLPGRAWEGIDFEDPSGFVDSFMFKREGAKMSRYSIGTDGSRKIQARYSQYRVMSLTDAMRYTVEKLQGWESSLDGEFILVDNVDGAKFAYFLNADNVFEKYTWEYGHKEISSYRDHVMDSMYALQNKMNTEAASMTRDGNFFMNGSISITLTSTGFKYVNESEQIEVVVEAIRDIKEPTNVIEMGPFPDNPDSGNPDPGPGPDNPDPGNPDKPGQKPQMPDISGEIGQELQTSELWNSIDQTKIDLIRNVISTKIAAKNFITKTTEVASSTEMMNIKVAGDSIDCNVTGNRNIVILNGEASKARVARTYTKGLTAYDLSYAPAKKHYDDYFLEAKSIEDIINNIQFKYDATKNYFTYVNKKYEAALYLTADGLVLYLAMGEGTYKYEINNIGTTTVSIPADVIEMTLISEAWEGIDLGDLGSIARKFGQNNLVRYIVENKGNENSLMWEEISKEVKPGMANIVRTKMYISDPGGAQYIDFDIDTRSGYVFNTADLKVWDRFTFNNNNSLEQEMENYKQSIDRILEHITMIINESKLIEGKKSETLYENTACRLTLSADGMIFEDLKDVEKTIYTIKIATFPEEPKNFVDQGEYPDKNPGGGDQGGDVWQGANTQDPTIIDVVNKLIEDNYFSIEYHDEVNLENDYINVETINRFKHKYHNDKSGTNFIKFYRFNGKDYDSFIEEGAQGMVNGTETTENVQNYIGQIRTSLRKFVNQEWTFNNEMGRFICPNNYEMEVFADTIDIMNNAQNFFLRVRFRGIEIIFPDEEHAKPDPEKPGPEKPDQNKNVWQDYDVTDPTIIERAKKYLSDSNFRIEGAQDNVAKNIIVENLERVMTFSKADKQEGIGLGYRVDPSGTGLKYEGKEKETPQITKVSADEVRNYIQNIIKQMDNFLSGTWTFDQNQQAFLNDKQNMLIFVPFGFVVRAQGENPTFEFNIYLHDQYVQFPDEREPGGEPPTENIWKGQDETNPAIIETARQYITDGHFRSSYENPDQKKLEEIIFDCNDFAYNMSSTDTTEGYVIKFVEPGKSQKYMNVEGNFVPESITDEVYNQLHKQHLDKVMAYLNGTWRFNMEQGYFTNESNYILMITQSGLRIELKPNEVVIIDFIDVKIPDVNGNNNPPQTDFWNGVPQDTPEVFKYIDAQLNEANKWNIIIECNTPSSRKVVYINQVRDLIIDDFNANIETTYMFDEAEKQYYKIITDVKGINELEPKQLVSQEFVIAEIDKYISQFRTFMGSAADWTYNKELNQFDNKLNPKKGAGASENGIKIEDDSTKESQIIMFNYV